MPSFSGLREPVSLWAVGSNEVPHVSVSDLVSWSHYDTTAITQLRLQGKVELPEAFAEGKAETDNSRIASRFLSRAAALLKGGGAGSRCCANNLGSDTA
ncbi:hypothetical protein LMG29542_07657 [Paraburkholderia humisilvae]|uniref:Uncharacterized protein n=1 Tax=Paraburkholderia humisilvae TaxID=627669 RepID=A0A6J5FAJ6_9BURK|nr:hypothetical protein LMG29542_07657 [Paraburkholderia humisilvae]